MMHMSDRSVARPAWLVMLGPCLSIALASSAISIAAVAQPALADAFPDARRDVSYVVSAFILATTVASVPVGRAGDVFGAGRVLLAGLVVFTLGALAAARAGSLDALILARAVQGLGASAMLTMPLALVRGTIPLAQTGRWMGLLGSLSAIGTATGPALGGFLVATHGWPSVFVAQIPLPILIFAMAARVLPNFPPSKGAARFDILGTITLAVTLLAICLVLSEPRSGQVWKMVPLGVVAAVGLLFFIHIEKRARDPMIDIEQASDRILLKYLSSNGLISMIMMGLLVVGPFYLIRGAGLSTPAMGLVMSIGPVAAILGGVPAGRFSESLGAERALVRGTALLALGAAAMAVLPIWAGVPGFAAAFLTLALAYQVFLAALNTAVMTRAPEHARGRVSGLIALSRNLGFVIGASLMPSLFDGIFALSQSLHWPVPHAQVAMTATFAGATCLALVSVLLVAHLGPEEERA